MNAVSTVCQTPLNISNTTKSSSKLCSVRRSIIHGRPISTTWHFGKHLQYLLPELLDMIVLILDNLQNHPLQHSRVLDQQIWKGMVFRSLSHSFLRDVDTVLLENLLGAGSASHEGDWERLVRQLIHDGLLDYMVESELGSTSVTAGLCNRKWI